MGQETPDGRSPFRQLAEDYQPGDEPEEGKQECGLHLPEWSVVSFDRVEARGLTHAQAIHRMAALDSAGVPGLCIVTDAAAARG